MPKTGEPILVDQSLPLRHAPTLARFQRVKNR